ncbi:hypothetical protein [Chlorobaculum limnaeum]|nr:hypothetical protein [Chlorobaculum limnaeum]
MSDKPRFAEEVDSKLYGSGAKPGMMVLSNPQMLALSSGSRS